MQNRQLLRAGRAGVLHGDGVLFQQGHRVVRQLAGPQTGVAGVVLPVDEVDAVPDKVLGKLGHQHLIAALIVPVRLFDVGEQGVPREKPTIWSSTVSIPPSRS